MRKIGVTKRRDHHETIRLLVVIDDLWMLAPFACSKANAEEHSVLCHCTVNYVPATVCVGTLDNDWCIELVNPTYCGSNGNLDC